MTSEIGCDGQGTTLCAMVVVRQCDRVRWMLRPDQHCDRALVELLAAGPDAESAIVLGGPIHDSQPPSPRTQRNSARSPAHGMVAKAALPSSKKVRSEP